MIFLEKALPIYPYTALNFLELS